LIANRPRMVDGEMILPQAPGFGWELDWEFAARHRVDR
jgi:D-galactarolactone cycloisomerase